MTFKNELGNIKSIIDEKIASIIDYSRTEKIIADSMNYSLLANGKRVRPILAILIAKALGGDELKALPFAISLECIHTYSLIHDDLPAMDNDDLRRGLPTNHIKFGEANAILAGDALLNLAFEIIFSEIEKSDYNRFYSKIGREVSNSSGIYGMIQGQVIDIESEGKKISIERLIEMHSKKTGALIESSCVVGALVAEREDMVEISREYGKKVGLIFQIIDDILDYTGDSKLLGKNVGSDVLKEKSTFVSLIGLEKSKELSEKLTLEAIEIADKIDKTGLLSEFTRYLLKRNK